MQPKSGLERDVALGDDNGLAEVRPMSRGREAVAARLAERVAGVQLDRGRSACPPPSLSPLQPNRTGGVLTKQRSLADIPAKHRRALVARLLGDDALGHPGGGCRGCQTGPQRVTGYLTRVEPSAEGVAFQHERHRLFEIAEAAGCSKAYASDIRRGKWTPHVST